MTRGLNYSFFQLKKLNTKKEVKKKNTHLILKYFPSKIGILEPQPFVFMTLPTKRYETHNTCPEKTPRMKHNILHKEKTRKVLL